MEGHFDFGTKQRLTADAIKMYQNGSVETKGIIEQMRNLFGVSELEAMNLLRGFNTSFYIDIYEDHRKVFLESNKKLKFLIDTYGIKTGVLKEATVDFETSFAKAKLTIGKPFYDSNAVDNIQAPFILNFSDIDGKKQLNNVITGQVSSSTVAKTYMAINEYKYPGEDKTKSKEVFYIPWNSIEFLCSPNGAYPGRAGMRIYSIGAGNLKRKIEISLTERQTDDLGKLLIMAWLDMQSFSKTMNSDFDRKL